MKACGTSFSQTFVGCELTAHFLQAFRARIQDRHHEN